MTDQPTEDRLRRAGKVTRTIATVVIALAVAALATTSVYTTWIEEEPAPAPVADYAEDMALFSCLDLAHAVVGPPADMDFQDQEFLRAFQEGCGALYPDPFEGLNKAIDNAWDAEHPDE